MLLQLLLSSLQLLELFFLDELFKLLLFEFLFPLLSPFPTPLLLLQLLLLLLLLEPLALLKLLELFTIILG